MGRAQCSESHLDDASSLMDSGGGKKSTFRKLKPSITKIHIATYNCRTMRTDDHLEELEEELRNIKWDIIGLCETRLPGEKRTTLKSGHTLYQNNSESNYSQGGVAFIVHCRIEHKVTKYCKISDRVIYLVIQINNRYSLQLIHCYAPTSMAQDEQIEQLYEDIAHAKNLENTQYVIVSGDFNAKIGRRQPGDSKYIGYFGLGDRNERGDMLANLLNNEKLFCLNTFFQKPPQRKWTWRSPDGRTKNEIDFIFANKTNICKDISVLNQFHTGSDHRLVRASIQIDTKMERKKLLTRSKIPTRDVLYLNKETYQNELTNRINPTALQEKDIDEIAENIKKGIHTATKKICSKIKNKIETKLKPETIKLIKTRRNTNRDDPEYKTINKIVKTEIRTDLRNHKTRQILETIENNKNMKVLKFNRMRGKQEIMKIKNKHGRLIADKREITEEIQQFYEKLYTSTIPNPYGPPKHILNVGSEEMPDISLQEIEYALQKMKNGKSPGEDQITSEMLKMGGKVLREAVRILLNKCLMEGRIPESWNNAEIVLIHKKGDNTNLENYRPISLLSHLYKLFTRIITNRITAKLDSYQPVEQAGFRKGYSTVDHLQTIRTIIEKASEYNIPINLAFVDYHKAFDSIEKWAFLTALEDARVDSRYCTIMKAIYDKATFHVKINDDIKTDKIKIGKGVRQGDTISPKLFTLALENVFKQLNWENRGLNIDGMHLHHLRFADDIVLISTDLDELNIMLNELNEESRKIGLHMNLNKTKIMSNIPQYNITIDNTTIENVDHYIYLGHKIKLGKENQNAEIKRRIHLAWVAFGKLNYIFKDKKVPLHLKRKAYNSCILPVITYGLETMAITRKVAEQLKVTQRAMERVMLGITLRDKVRNRQLRDKTKITDVIERVASLKWRWIGHVARQDSERWTHRITFWRPRETRRSVGRPQKRWTDDIKEVAGSKWMRKAKDRKAWQNMEEAYVRHWMNPG